jgi:hypothetical protein
MNFNHNFKALIFAFFTSTLVLAQDQDNTQLWLVHEDHVFPSKAAEYAEISKKLVGKLTEHNVKGMTFFAQWQGYTCLYARPIENFAALDENNWKPLIDAMGEEAFTSMMGDFDDCYHSHRNYIAVHHLDLSYKPEQIQENPELMYRIWDYFYIYPDKFDEAKALMAEWKELYTSVGVERGYNIFTNGFGHDGPAVVVYRWAENAEDFSNHNLANQKLLGEKGQTLWDKTQAVMHKYERKAGFAVQEMSYMGQE